MKNNSNNNNIIISCFYQWLFPLFFLVFTVLVLNVRVRADESRQPIAWDGIGWIPLIEEERPPYPHPIRSESWKTPNASIFIGIAAFRDSRCPQTLKNLYTKAKYPDRIFVGLVQQSDSQKDVDCLEKYCEIMGVDADDDLERSQKCPFFNNIRIHRVTHLLARGPTFGRHLQAYLIRDEEFCMQTDSHMDYVDHWDDELLKMWAMPNNEYAIISTYVNRFEDLESGLPFKERIQVPYICQLEYVRPPLGMPRNKQAKGAVNLTRPKLSPFWAAGFSFLKCHGEKQTPNDAQFPGVFDGEEYSKGARMWTRGYDIYTPHKPLLFHDYNKPKDYNPMSWKRDQQDYQRAKKRMFTLLEMEGGDNTTEAIEALGRYGLGERRSLDQYIKFTGNDIRHRKAFESRCGTLDWVPFEEHPLGPEGPLLEQQLEFGAMHEKQWPNTLTREDLEGYFSYEELVALKDAAKGYEAWPVKDKDGAQIEEPYANHLPPRLQRLIDIEEKAVKEIEDLASAKFSVTFNGLTLIIFVAGFLVLCGLMVLCFLMNSMESTKRQRSNSKTRYH